TGPDALAVERRRLATGLADLQGTVAALFGFLADAEQDRTALYRIGQHTTRLLLATGDLLTGWLLVRQAEVALAALAGEVPEADRSFYEGKLAAAHFFTGEVLPRLAADRVVVESTDDSLMAAPERVL
ncbi:acyl-CoA dehydrogenase C-terminal domain-containing protein, partial [Modestobacter versicolor]